MSGLLRVETICFVIIVTMIQSVILQDSDWFTSMVNEFYSSRRCASDLCQTRYPLFVDGQVQIGEWNTTAVTGPNDMDDFRFISSGCHCDDRCALFGDCCWDAAIKYWTSATDDMDEDSNSVDSWSCLPLRTKDNAQDLDDLYYVYMIGKCPENTAIDNPQQRTLEAMCERRQNGDYTYSHLMDIPVLSLETNQTYANIYCARCNSDAEKLANWSVSIQCTEHLDQFNVSHEEMFNDKNYMPGLRRWSQSLEGSSVASVACDIIIEEFKDFKNYIKTTDSRKCIPKIDKCAPEWTNQDDDFKCSLYSLYVQDSLSNAYKNPHCARCNNVLANETTCFWKTIFITMRTVPPRGRLNGYSFSMVLDFSFGNSGGNQVGVTTKCGPDEIFDHLHNRCHPVICGNAFTYQNGICVPSLIDDSDDVEDRENLLSGSLNSTCKRIILIENEDYYMLDNGSLIVNKTGQMLHAEEYELLDSGDSVQICADTWHQRTFFKYSKAQSMLSDICLAISVICLAFHIAIHAALPKLRNLPGKNLLSLSCALFIAQLLFLTVVGAREAVGYGCCAALGVLTHWSFLSAFFWMNIMGYDICRTFTGQKTRRSPGAGQRTTFRYYSLYAWGCPSIIVALGLILDFTSILDDYAPMYGDHICWISNKNGLGIFLVLPIVILLLENCVLFSLTVFSIFKQHKEAQYAVDKNQSYRTEDGNPKLKPSALEKLQPPSNQQIPKRNSTKSHGTQKMKIRCILYIKLALIMGLGWVFGFIAAMAKLPALWYPFILFNALQGAFIFLAFDCKRKIYFMIYLWINKRPHPSDSSASSRPGISSNKATSNIHSQRTSAFVTNTTGSSDIESDRPSSQRVDAEIHYNPNLRGSNSPSTASRPPVTKSNVHKAKAALVLNRWIHRPKNLPVVVVTDCSIREEVDPDSPDPTMLGVRNFQWRGNQQLDLQPLACHPAAKLAEVSSNGQLATREQPVVHQPLKCHLINQNNKFYIDRHLPCLMRS